MIEAREDQIESNYNFSLADYATTKGRGWVVVSNQIAYLRQALVNDTVIITSKLRHLANTFIDVECLMFNVSKSHVKSVLWMRFLSIDLRSQKVVSHDEELMTFFKSLEFPMNELTFDDRTSALRNWNKIKEDKSSFI